MKQRQFGLVVPGVDMVDATAVGCEQAAHPESEMPSSALLPTARASDRVAHSRRPAL